MKYEIEIEKIDEEFEIIDVVDTLAEARLIAYQVPRETYKNKFAKNFCFIFSYFW